MRRDDPRIPQDRSPTDADFPTLVGMPSPQASSASARPAPRTVRFGVLAACLALTSTMTATTASPAHASERTMLRGDGCNHSAPKVSSPRSAPVRMATFNIRASMSTSTFSAGVKALLPYADIVGLQEVNSKDKAEKLAEIKRSTEWDFWRQYRTHVASHPKRGGTEQQPVMWRSSRFVCTYSGPMLASGLISLKGEAASGDGTVRHWFSVIHLVDRVTGQRLSIVNVHMLHGAVAGGRPIRSRPKHWRTYRIQMTNLIRKTQNQQGYGKVFIMGDFNAGWVADRKHRHKHLPFRSFRHIGYRSMWATEHPGSRGTHNDALIDQVYSRSKARSAQVLFALGQYSDHRPAVATYGLSARR